MAIILEGPDAAGKSTLGRLLRDQFGFHIVTSGGAPKNPKQMVEYCEMQLDASYDRKAVLDRITPISHPIYHEQYRGDRMLKDYLNRILELPHLVVVYCRPSNDNLMKPEKHQWKDYDTEADKQRILENQMLFIQEYDRVFQTIRHLAYDYANTDVDADIVALLAATKDHDEAFRYIEEIIDRSLGGRGDVASR